MARQGLEGLEEGRDRIKIAFLAEKREVQRGQHRLGQASDQYRRRISS